MSIFLCNPLCFIINEGKDVTTVTLLQYISQQYRRKGTLLIGTFFYTRRYMLKKTITAPSRTEAANQTLSHICSGRNQPSSVCQLFALLAKRKYIASSHNHMMAVYFLNPAELKRKELQCLQIAQNNGFVRGYRKSLE